MQKPLAFLYAYNESRRKRQTKYPVYNYAFQKAKYLRIRLTKKGKDLHKENYRPLFNK